MVCLVANPQEVQIRFAKSFADSTVNYQTKTTDKLQSQSQVLQNFVEFNPALLETVLKQMNSSLVNSSSYVDQSDI